MDVRMLFVVFATQPFHLVRSLAPVNALSYNQESRRKPLPRWPLGAGGLTNAFFRNWTLRFTSDNSAMDPEAWPQSASRRAAIRKTRPRSEAPLRNRAHNQPGCEAFRSRKDDRREASPNDGNRHQTQRLSFPIYVEQRKITSPLCPGPTFNQKHSERDRMLARNCVQAPQVPCTSSSQIAALLLASL